MEQVSGSETSTATAIPTYGIVLNAIMGLVLDMGLDSLSIILERHL